MFTRRKLSISVALMLALTLLMTLSASAQAPALGGTAHFRDANAASDSLVVDFTRAAVLSHGSTYEGWLIDTDDNKLSTGRLGRGPFLQGEYVSPGGADLLARYSTFVITVEPLDDPDPAPSGVIAYGAATRGAVLSHVSALVGEGGAATAVRNHAAQALAYAEAGDADAAAGMLDGIVASARESSAVASDLLFSSASGGDENVEATANDIIDASNNVIRLASEVRDAASRVSSASGIEAEQETKNLLAWASRLYSGTDQDGQALGEDPYGAVHLYELSQDLGAFRPNVGAPPATGDSLVPMVALAALVLGAAFVLSGGLVVFRSRRRAFA
ncbi:MAG: hypothetical protein F4Z88_11365 [Chloroflexi bacterium]|nr:hypothetical protein [Chloroflexota bacterium]